MSIATLLPELLTEIFFHVVAYCRAWSPLESYYKWIYVTHVNRYWRAVALDCGSLWSHIPLLRPECVKVFLVRSGQAPLMLTLGPSHFPIQYTESDIQRYMESFKMTLDYLHRVTEARVRGNFWFECQEVKALRDAPMLERFELCDSLLDWGDGTLFKFKQHRLKELVLRRNNCFGGPSGQAETFRDVLCALQDISTLETLVLSGITPEVSLTQAAKQPAITLPRLRFLHIEGKTYVISLLLDKIICPTMTAICLEHHWRSCDSSEMEAEYVQFADSMSSKLCGDTAIGAAQPLLTLEIDIEDSWTVWMHGTIVLRGWTTAQADDSAIPVRTDRPCISIGFYPTPTHTARTPFGGTLGILCDRLPLSTVRILSIGRLTYLADRGVTSSWFHWAKNVETLRLSMWTVRRILDAKLLDFPEEVACMEGRQALVLNVPFPRLRTLWLDIESDNKEDSEHLKVMLDMRMQHGTLKTIWFVQPCELLKLYG